LEDYYELGTLNGVEGRSYGSFYDTDPTYTRRDPKETRPVSLPPNVEE
jgi:hypothetical protein